MIRKLAPHFLYPPGGALARGTAENQPTSKHQEILDIDFTHYLKMPAHTRSQKRPLTPDNPTEPHEATTRRKMRFYEAYDT
jgi:hypothetical protein